MGLHSSLFSSESPEEDNVQLLLCLLESSSTQCPLVEERVRKDIGRQQLPLSHTHRGQSVRLLGLALCLSNLLERDPHSSHVPAEYSGSEPTWPCTLAQPFIAVLATVTDRL